MQSKKIKDKYDVIIIGSGLGGLECGYILAKEGKSVCILEKNAQIGGSLQTFYFDNKKFDTGVHYIGSLAPKDPLHQYFTYFDIMDKLTIEKMDEDGFDYISFEGDDNKYPHAQGFDNFVTQLSKFFPDEKEGIQQYIKEVEDVCDKFSLYFLRTESDIEEEFNQFSRSSKEVIESCTSNPKLQSILAGSASLYAGDGDHAPFYVHALIANSYIRSAYRLPKGGDEIARHLRQNLKKLNAEIHTRTEVIKINNDKNEVKSVILKDGREIFADLFISNVHPTQTFKLTNIEQVRKSYTRRILKLENTCSVFTVYISLKPKSLPYFNHNIYHHLDTDVWNEVQNSSINWVNSLGIFSNRYLDDPEYCKSLIVMTYMHYDEVEQWKDSYNTTLDKSDRFDEYQEFKESKAQDVITAMESVFPDLRSNIQDYKTSTPLTQRDYLGEETGSLYGVKRDYKSPLKSYIRAKTKLDNLYLTGQNIILHGILGVTIGAITTCNEILGREYLMTKVKKEIKEKETLNE